MSNRERFIYAYTLVAGIALLLGALADPPGGLWRIVLYAVIPITLILCSAWRLLSNRPRR